jgi:hypothetical protein
LVICLPSVAAAQTDACSLLKTSDVKEAFGVAVEPGEMVGMGTDWIRRAGPGTDGTLVIRLGGWTELEGRPDREMQMEPTTRFGRNRPERAALLQCLEHSLRRS